MTIYALKQDYPTELWGKRVTIPRGVKLRKMHGAGDRPDQYAVEDKTLLIRLTGDAGNALKHPALVPNELVAERERSTTPYVPSKRYR